MVKLVDTEVGLGGLVLRLFAALLVSALSLSVLYLAPGLLIDFLNSSVAGQFSGLLSQIMEPNLPSVGLVVTALVFLTVALRKTRLEGPLLIGLGIALFAYWYLAFHGGMMTLSIPETSVGDVMGSGIPADIEAQATVNLTLLMLSLMVTPLLVVVKGVMLSYVRFIQEAN